MKAVGLIATVLIASFLAVVPIFAETTMTAPTDSEAADVARFVADRADSLASKAAANDVEAEAQVHIREVAALASRLETEIRAGTSRHKTRRLYEAIRARRVAVIGLGMQGDIGVAATDIQVLERMLEELSAYYRER